MRCRRNGAALTRTRPAVGLTKIRPRGGSLRASLLTTLSLAFALAVPASGALAESPSAEFDRWLARAEQEDPDAQFRIGRYYERGYGRPRHYVLASSFFRKAAEQGHAEAAYRLGRLYLDGFGVPFKPATARHWFEEARAGGYSDAAAALGVMARYGIGQPPDATGAEARFREAAELGSLRGRLGLGLVLAEGTTAGDRRRRLGLQQLRIAARAGLAEAHYQLARLDPAADVRARLTAAANGDFAPAAYRLGVTLMDSADTALGRAYLYVAASNGLANAQHRLGLVHARGEGTRIDHDAATYWFGRAALSGHAEAQALLGMSLARGRGIGRDPVAGAAWCQVAGKRGSARGVEAAELILEALKPGEIELVAAEVRRIERAFAERPPGVDRYRFSPALR